jgi:hypothetical protein
MATRGRKNKYKTDVQTRLNEVEEWAKMGLSNEQIAHNLGITPKTFYEWQNKYSDFSEAIKRGKDVADFEVVNALHKKATGFSHTYIGGVSETGEPIECEKYFAPDTVAAIFWLKNRRPQEWKDKQEQEIELKGEMKHEVNQQVKELSTEELKALINIKVEE